MVQNDFLDNFDICDQIPLNGCDRISESEIEDTTHVLLDAVTSSHMEDPKLRLIPCSEEKRSTAIDSNVEFSLLAPPSNSAYDAPEANRLYS